MIKQIFKIVSTLIVIMFFSAGIVQAQNNTILLQIRPGYNPEEISYLKKARVWFNEKYVGGRLMITNLSDPITKEVKFPSLNTGEAFNVKATFQNKNNKDKIYCESSWTAIAPNDIGCGPIEVYYQAYNNSCVIICN